MSSEKWAAMRFEETPPDYGEIIPIQEWKESVECHCFTDYDGIGNWMKGGMVHSSSEGVRYMYHDNVCDPEEIEEAIQNGIEAVIWFNK